jgi:hypothetical protein
MLPEIVDATHQETRTYRYAIAIPGLESVRTKSIQYPSPQGLRTYRLHHWLGCGMYWALSDRGSLRWEWKMFLQARLDL